MDNRNWSGVAVSAYAFGGISETNRQEVSKQLTRVLADEYVLYTKTRNAHWNVEGHDFPDKHVFFETLYKQLETSIDEIAERIRALGHYAPATMAEYLKLTHLTELRRNTNDSKGYIAELLADHENIILNLRAMNIVFVGQLKDAGSGDFIARLMEEHEKIAWMLRSQLR